MTGGDPQTLMAFDYGTRRIGVAVGERSTGTARPLATVANRASGPDWGRIERLMAQWQPARLLVGLPLDLEGNEQPMTRAARRFARRLAGRYGLPVTEVDERLTTREAWQRRTDPGGPAPRAEVDAVAAALILETWLHEQP